MATSLLLLKNLINPPIQLGDGLKLDGFFVTDVAAIVHLTEVENENKSGVPAKDAVRSLIGNAVRIVWDFLNQTGVLVPCFCVVTPLPRESKLERIIRELAMDQDWGRGDFALLLEPRGSSQEKVSCTEPTTFMQILLDLDYADLGVSLEPISREEVVKNLRESIKTQNLSSDHAELLDMMCDCLESGTALSDELEKWVTNKKHEVEVLGMERGRQ